MINLARTSLFAILVITSSACVFAQESRKPILIDEFGLLPCDDMLGRADVLAAELHKEPTANAAIVVYRPIVQPTLAEKRRRFISSTLQLRGIDRARFNFFLAGEAEDGQIRSKFWKVPSGAAAPIPQSKRWNEPPVDVSRTFMFGYQDEIGECPTYVPANFAKLLSENPGSAGRIVVILGKGPIVDRFWFAGQFISELVQKQGVPRKRLRVIFRKGEDTAAEFWFVPARKK